MLIHIDGELDAQTIKKEKLELKIPKLYLDDFDYKISVRYVYIHGTLPIDSQTIFLSTNAIDRNSFNLDQEIFAFEAKGSNYVFGEIKT